MINQKIKKVIQTAKKDINILIAFCTTIYIDYKLNKPINFLLKIL